MIIMKELNFTVGAKLRILISSLLLKYIQVNKNVTL